MTDRDTDIVSAVRACLRQRLGEDRFELWFGNSYRLTWDSGTLRIDVESAFRADRVRARLLADVVAALSSIVAGPCEVVVGVDPKLKLTANETPADKSQTADTTQRGSAADTRGTVPEVAANHSPGQPHRARPATLPLPGVGIKKEAGGESEAINSARLSVDVNANTNTNTNTRPRARNGWRHREHAGHRFASLKTLVQGSSNRVAYQAARIVIEYPAQVNPLFVHGPSGSGKTHLLEGIWGEVRRRGGRRIIYLSAEQFTTYFLQALRGSGLPNFRQKYRAVDLFILDDVQFLAGKQATVTELLHTIDSLLRQSRQLVLAADRPPAELQHLGTDLQARISGGLVCAVQPLDFSMRQELISRLADERSLWLAPLVRDHVAQRAPGDARQLSGIVNRLWATEMTLGRPITLSLADEILGELCPDANVMINLQDIQRVICDEFNLAPEQLCSNRRTRNVSHPRMLAMWLARKHTRAALTEIGEFFGRRSHSTVVSAQNKVERWVIDGQQLQVTPQPCDVKTVLSRLERSLRA